MILYTHLHLPQGFSILYRFEKRGDGLPMHQHERDMEHSVACTRGLVAVYGPNKEGYKMLRPGESYVFDSTRPHEIAALEDHSSIVSVFIHGMPEGYDKLPFGCTDGVMDRTLTEPLDETARPEGLMEAIERRVLRG